MAANKALFKIKNELNCSSKIHNSPKATLPKEYQSPQHQHQHDQHCNHLKMEALSLSTESITTRLDELRTLWTKNNQEQVFKWADKLDNQQLTSFIEDLEQIDVADVNKVYATTASQEGEVNTPTLPSCP